MSKQMVPGNYKVNGVTAALIEARSGTPGVTVTLRVNEPADYKDELIEWTGWLTDAAKERTVESLVILGFDGADLSTCTSKEAIAVCENEEYDYTNAKGEQQKGTRLRVKWINDPSRIGAFKAMDEGRKGDMMSQLSGLTASFNAKKGTGTDAAPGAAPKAEPKW